MITSITIKGNRFYLLVYFILIQTSFVFGQITVSQTDMPQPGDTIRLSTCNSNAGLPNPALTGTNYLWDYTALIPFTQTVDTFLAVSSTPLAYQFFFNNGLMYPAYKATVAQAAPSLPALGPVTITKVINYYKDESSNYESVGYGAIINGLPTSVKDDTIDVMYVFPMTYGNSDSCRSSSQVSISGLGYYSTHQKRVNHVDGWGTLKTPFGSFNTLRVKTVLFSFDSLNIDTPIHIGFSTPVTGQIQYKWFANGFGLPILQVNEQIVAGNPVFTSAVYRDSARKALLGLNQINSSINNCLVYPNPGSGNFTFQVDGNYAPSGNYGVKIYNMTGQVVYNNIFITPHQNPSFNVNLCNQPSGLYIYTLVNDRGERVATGRLVISR